jgi:hypothetical protein
VTSARVRTLEAEPPQALDELPALTGLPPAHASALD